jgi:hypothetical protein
MTNDTLRLGVHAPPELEPDVLGCAQPAVPTSTSDTVAASPAKSVRRLSPESTMTPPVSVPQRGSSRSMQTRRGPAPVRFVAG